MSGPTIITFLGLDVDLWVNMIGTAIGALVAISVAYWITPKIANARAVRDQQEKVLRALIMTRLSPVNPDYNNAINLIPIDFKGHRLILEARDKYLDIANDRSGEDRAIDLQRQLDHLIALLAKALGFQISESDLAAEKFYASTGSRIREDLEIDSQRAWLRIAAALEKQTVLNEIALGIKPSTPVADIEGAAVITESQAPTPLTERPSDHT